MDLNLKITLFIRLIAAQDESYILGEYITITHDGTGNIESYTWDHETMVEPTQEELDSEDLIYQEELLITELMPLVSILAVRLIPTLEYWVNWYQGDYVDSKWQDEVINESNAQRRLDLQAEVDDYEANKTIKEAELVDLNAELVDLEANENPTVAVLDRIQLLINNLIPQMEVLIGQIAQLIVDRTADKDALTDVVVITKPTLQALKDELIIYNSEIAAEKIRIDTEEAEMAAMNLNAALQSLIDKDVRFWKHGNKGWDSVIIVSGEAKPTWQEVKDEWAIQAPILIAEATREAKKVGGQIVRNICSNILDLVAGNNLEKALTVVQIDQMEVDYADLFTALQNFRPDKAAGLTFALTPDGTLVTQADKDEYLAEFAKHGL